MGRWRGREEGEKGQEDIFYAAWSAQPSGTKFRSGALSAAGNSGAGECTKPSRAEPSHAQPAVRPSIGNAAAAALLSILVPY